ncbi:AAA family ATPase [Rhabdothermincola sediminis]|uniref:AAA family ATPase n=1 Tax=Rhabdothermincola sediminis TaxID=2751370 RepID=UPI001AA07B23|nr:P-loop NTPase [Rhabdothermincola sediminis]
MPRPVGGQVSGGGAPQVAVVVVDADQAVRSRLAMQLGQGATPFPSLSDLTARLSGQPVVVVLGPSFAGTVELTAAEQLLAARREVGAIMVTTELTTELLQRALRAGVKDVLQAPVDSGQLAEAVARVAATLTPAVSAPVPTSFAEGEGLGRVITVFSTKGGAGKSVIATNLAVVLAQRSERPVVLIDADLQFGDIAVMLKLAPQHTIVDAVSALDRLDLALMQSLLITHNPSGLRVLPAPLEPAFADQIGATEMVRIVELLRQFCAFVVIDTPAYFNDVVLGLIEESDDVLLVAGMDIPNIKNVKIGLQTLRLLNTPMEKVKLILNRANSKVKLDVGEVERTLGVQAEALVPSDVVVPQAVNKGEAVVLVAPKSGVAKSMEDLADLFIPVEGKKKRR